MISLSTLSGALPGGSLVRAFRGDAALRRGFLALSIASLSPLFATPILPHADLHGDASSAAMLLHTALGSGSTRDFYEVSFRPFPYWLAYAFMAAMHALGGPFFSAKAVVGLLVLLLPLSVMRLLIALDRDPRLSLWAFALSWNFCLHAGRHAFLLGVALGFFVLARAIEASSRKQALRLWPWSLLLGLSHPLALGFAGLAGLAAAASGRRPWSRAGRVMLAFSGSAIVLVPWLIERLVASSGAGHSAAFRADFPSPRDRVSGLFAFSVDTLGGAGGEALAALSFSLLLLGPLALSRAPEREGDDPHRTSGAAIFGVALSLYGLLPMSLYGPVDDWQIYLRFAPFVLASALLIPRPDLSRSPLLWAGALLAALVPLSTFVSYRQIGDRMRPFLAVVDAVPRGARLLPLEYDKDDRSLPIASFAHIHSYITAEKHGFDPHFFDNPNTPIRYRRDLSIPRISWLNPDQFTFARYAPHYTHILVQGLARDPLVGQPPAAGFQPRLALESGIWRLYTIERAP